MIHIQIPATSANMGPGFDSIGVAVQLYNHIWVEEQTDGLTIEVRRKQELEVPTDETNLIYQTMKFFYEKLCWRDIRIIPTLRSLAAWWSAHRMKKK